MLIYCAAKEATDSLSPYNVAGQKFPTPTPGFGDRVFYETLYRQRPDSSMAQEWCVSYGVLSSKEAEKVHKKVVERKRKQKGGMSTSPVKPKKTKKKSTMVKEESVDPDLQISGGDAVGRAIL